jgi:hypothetical protein
MFNVQVMYLALEEFLSFSYQKFSLAPIGSSLLEKSNPCREKEEEKRDKNVVNSGHYIPPATANRSKRTSLGLK